MHTDQWPKCLAYAQNILSKTAEKASCEKKISYKSNWVDLVLKTESKTIDLHFKVYTDKVSLVLVKPGVHGIKIEVPANFQVFQRKLWYYRYLWGNRRKEILTPCFAPMSLPSKFAFDWDTKRDVNQKTLNRYCPPQYSPENNKISTDDSLYWFEFLQKEDLTQIKAFCWNRVVYVNA